MSSPRSRHGCRSAPTPSLADAFIEHIDSFWPEGRDQGSSDWIRANVDEVLAVIEWLYNVVAETTTGGAMEFVDRDELAAAAAGRARPRPDARRVAARHPTPESAWVLMPASGLPPHSAALP